MLGENGNPNPTIKNMKIQFTEELFGNLLLALACFFLILDAIKYQSYILGFIGFLISQFSFIKK